MNDTSEAVSVAFKGGELTVELMAKLLPIILDQIKKRLQPTIKEGKQAVKSLTEQGDELATIPIENPDLKNMQKELKGLGVDFSLKAGKEQENILFFKAKDSAQIEYAIEKMIDKTQHKGLEPIVTMEQDKLKSNKVQEKQSTFGNKKVDEVIKEAKVKANNHNKNLGKTKVKAKGKSR